ncbi:MAG: amidohydrolase family protein [Gammaproteobacteria bacterium]
MADTLDLKITGGMIVDGTGGAAYLGDVGVRDGRIVALGKVDQSARETVDAEGRVVAPGFVDIHTHYDAQVFWDPTLSPSSHHGVTTIVGGNCGFSIAPLNGVQEDAEYLMRMLARVEGMPLESLRAGVPWNWRTTAEYLGLIEGRLAINAGFMVGHSALRRAVMGARAVGDKATEDEIRQMQALLRDGLAAGGMGFSTTVSPSHNDAEGNPVPSRHATDAEIYALAAVAGEFEGTTLELLPNTVEPFTEDQYRRLAQMSLAAKRPVNWNVLSPDSRFPDLYRNQIQASDYAAERGAKVVPLIMSSPPTIWVNFISGFILDTFPGWTELFRHPVAERTRLLADPAQRLRMNDAQAWAGAGRRAVMANWAAWTFAEVFHPENKRFQGRTVGEAAQALGKAPFDAMIDICIADDLKTSLQTPMAGEDDETWRVRVELWKDERTVVGASDAGAHLDMIDTFASPLFVLSLGVRERRLITLEQAVRQLTSVPARLYGLRERGELAAGNWADIVVFDPATIARGPLGMRFDLPAGAGRLYADAVGIEHVFVNGVRIVRGQSFTGQLPGRVLRSGRDSYTVPIPASA